MIIIQEIWKSIKEYDNYQISNLGRVYSLKSNRILLGWTKKNKPNYDKYHWYRWISFCENGKEKRFQVHRLVAEHFIPNPENKPFVNHINGIKDDNRVENLEWVTAQENTQHAYNTGLEKFNKKTKIAFEKANKERSYKIIEINSQQVYSSIREAARQLEIGKTTISRSLKENKSVIDGKYKFKYCE